MITISKYEGVFTLLSVSKTASLTHLRSVSFIALSSPEHSPIRPKYNFIQIMFFNIYSFRLNLLKVFPLIKKNLQTKLLK